MNAPVITPAFAHKLPPKVPTRDEMRAAGIRGAIEALQAEPETDHRNGMIAGLQIAEHLL